MKRVSSEGGSPHSPIKENQNLVVHLNENKVRCLVCQTEVRDKTYSIQRHYNLSHASEYEGITGDERKDLIAKFKSELSSTHQVN